MFTCSESRVDNVIGNAVIAALVVLDDEEDGVALIAQLTKDVDEPLVVAPELKLNRRFVQHVERADERRSKRCRQVDATLELASQKVDDSRSSDRVIKVRTFAEKRESSLNLFQHLSATGDSLLTQLQRGKELACGVYGQAAFIIRAQDREHSLGNELTSLFVELPLTEADPLARYRRVQERAQELKPARRGPAARQSSTSPTWGRRSRAT